MAIDPLEVAPETMRQLGYQAVDMLVDWLVANGETPLARSAPREELERRLMEPSPNEPASFEEILTQLQGDVLSHMNRGDHPRFFAFIPSCGTWPGALGDLIASACNIYSGSWDESAGPSMLELVILDWFKQWIGYPPEATGILLSGGSAANMTALACARESRIGSMSDDVVAYVSDQAHSSLARAARVLGFQPHQLRVLPVDEHYRMRPDALEDAIDSDLRAGRRPMFVAASAGSTNTGAIDPLLQLAEIAHKRELWFHVDAAYGGFSALTERGRGWLAGIELADSVTLDPHKWLYQPFECGCLLVRDAHALHRAFQITPDYLKDVESSEQDANFSDLGLQLTRMCRAVKVWLSLKYFGVDAFRQAIDHSLDLARLAQRRIEASEELELLNPASLGIVCFRRRCEDTAEEDRLATLNAALVGELAASGLGLISSTRLKGRYALRLCVLNHTTRAQDVAQVLDWIAQQPLPTESATKALPQIEERHPDVLDAWAGGSELDPVTVRAIPLFSSLSESQLELIARSSSIITAPPGTTVLTRWDYGRDFFVILNGAAEVRVEQELVRALGPGEFFGELAALDWGASFSYPRLATVTAASPLRLLVLPGHVLNDLVHAVPDMEVKIRHAIQQRLPKS
ncbi:MAG: aromatic-L-amino-acid/L-tryptophan decarboxylase [Actinomycetota bacterium]|jgi:glutamate/tyrosine decarboxylase-like PLP-dependent enzyme|nr:aromatic-L-amino-acid/L-tryptophan decarboxylase [Actinomycetota bacterium]